MMYCYINGDFVEAEGARISVFDPGFMRGEAVFDVWRTYGGNLVTGVFSRHLRRLEGGLRYLGVYRPDVIEEIGKATSDLVKMNVARLGDGGDLRFWCGVTTGTRTGGESDLPTVAITATEVDFRSLFRTNLYETGAHLVPSLAVKSPWGAVDPRIKTTSRLGLAQGDAKHKSDPGDRWALLFDSEGHITEVVGASLALIKDGCIIHAPRDQILGGISLSIFRDLGRELGATVREQNLSTFDFLNADEVWLMSSSIAAVPVLSIDGIPLNQKSTLGQDILLKWIGYVGFDFRAQAIAHWRKTAEVPKGSNPPDRHP